jgi:U32 family peptidase
VRVYLAMNTLLTEKDLPEAIGLLHQAAPLSPDAIIVQDLGLLRIVRDFFPGLPIHASTQAGCASLAAAEAFARMGAERVILERHLRLSEIRRIAEQSPAGVEIFVHGSLCYSFSGKCFFSSYLGGKSANRGACVQPCRRLYGHAGGEGTVFSTRDLSLIDSLPELASLGFAAFKIEGRMRSAEYVAGVTAAYRAALDLIRAGRPGDAVAEGKERLRDVIGREETPGLPGGARPDAVVAGGETGSVGDLLGTVREVRDGWAAVPAPGGEAAPEAPRIRKGDRLRVQFRSDGSGRGFTALEVRIGPESLSVKVPFPVSPGDLLFRVGGGGRAGITRQARRDVEALPSAGVSFRVTVRGGTVSIAASYGTVRKEYAYRVAGSSRSGSASLPPDGPARLAAAYAGRFDLPLGDVAVEAHGPAVSWSDVESLFVKAAHAFDRDFYLAGKKLRLVILPALRVSGSRREEEGPTLFFVGCRADQLPHLPEGPEVVPVVELTKAAARDPVEAVRGFRGRSLYFRLPAPLLEAEASFFRRTVREAVGKGYRRWVVGDVGHFRIFAEPGTRARGGVTFISDHYLYAFNMGALSTLSRLGATRMILPVEAKLEDLAAVGKYLYGLGIACAYGAVPLMVSRLVPPPGVHGEVRSPRDERLVVEAEERGSVLRPAVPYSASGHLHEIRAAGIRDFYADVRGLPGREIGDILSALFADREIPGTSPFNLLRRSL